MGLNNALKRDLVGGGNFLRQRFFGQLIERFHDLHVALPWRRPVELGHGNMLLFESSLNIAMPTLMTFSG
jgi:hypothetical protein